MVVSSVPGLARLWRRTLGQKGVRIAVLDGPVDRSHPAFAGAKLEFPEGLGNGSPGCGAAFEHGTHVASILFGRHGGPVQGVAPGCTGIVIPIFRDGSDGALAPSNEVDLARAISKALDAKAHVINISGGQFSPTGEAHPALGRAVARCVSRNVLIVAAAGNDGCACQHVPGAMPAVLAVGAMNSKGEPLDFSNWGERYQRQGILALGEGVLGAKCGGGTARYGGTSVATPIVSGVVGLLLSLQMAAGRRPDPQGVREALLGSALGCESQKVPDCRRLLVGRLNINDAMSLITEGNSSMSERKEVHQPVPSDLPEGASTATASGAAPAAAVARSREESANESGLAPACGIGENQGAVGDGLSPEPARAIREPSGPAAAGSPLHPQIDGERYGPPRPRSSPPPSSAWPSRYSRLYPSACACDGGNAPRLVYALGTVYYDFGTEARRDSIGQAMGIALGDEKNPDDPFQLLNYLDSHPWDSSSVIWTLNDETTPIYAIQPDGGYADETYKRLREFLRDQIESGVERVSIPGYMGGRVRLYIGMEVPVIFPDLRGMYSWSTKAMVDSVCGKEPADSASPQKKKQFQDQSDALRSFLDRVYYDIRNMGQDPRDRAINYSATNAFNIQRVFERAVKESMSLDEISVERSPVCRPDSDCWDVKLIFFVPEKQLEVARKVYRFTVDVSDVVPVLVGDVRQWSIR